MNISCLLCQKKCWVQTSTIQHRFSNGLLFILNFLHISDVQDESYSSLSVAVLIFVSGRLACLPFPLMLFFSFLYFSLISLPVIFSLQLLCFFHIFVQVFPVQIFIGIKSNFSILNIYIDSFSYRQLDPLGTKIANCAISLQSRNMLTPHKCLPC